MDATQVNLKCGFERAGQLCNKILTDKLSKALHYIVQFSIYEPELTWRELNTSQSLLLSLIYGLLNRDVSFCLNVTEACFSSPLLGSSYIKVWLKDDFIFNRNEIAKVFSNLSTLIESLQSEFQLPQNVIYAFSGLIEKYHLLEYFFAAKDSKGLEIVTALSAYTHGSKEEGMKVTFSELMRGTRSSDDCHKHNLEPRSAVKSLGLEFHTKSTQTSNEKQNELRHSKVKSSGVKLSINKIFECNYYGSIQNGEKNNGTYSSKEDSESTPLEVRIGPCGSSSSSDIAISSVRNETLKPSQSKDDMKTCLENAVRHNDHTTMVSLLELGLDPNEINEFGEKPLHIAVSAGCEKSVRILLNFGAIPDYKDNDFFTPIQLAVKLNNPAILEILVKHGVNINQLFGNGNALLHEAAIYGYIGALNALIKLGANVDQINHAGYTALHLAAKADQVEAMEALIKANASLTITSERLETCLHLAAGACKVETVKILIEAGADPYLKEKNGHNALHLTLSTDILKYFVRVGVDINSKTDDGDTVLHLSVQRGGIEFVRTIIALNAEVDCLDKNKRTPLFLAVESGNSTIVSLLLNAGADVNFRDPETDDYLLHVAVENGKLEIVKLLLAAGADVNANGYDDLKPIHNASMNGSVPIVSLLIEKGADVKARTKKMDTALHWAAYYGFRNTIELLLDKGADVNAKGDGNKTPLRVAINHRRTSVINLLKWRGGKK